MDIVEIENGLMQLYPDFAKNISQFPIGERLDHFSSSWRPLKSLAASTRPLSLQARQAQELSLDLKRDVDSLREVSQELSKDTSREASGHDADIMALSSKLEELTRRSSHSSSVGSRIE